MLSSRRTPPAVLKTDLWNECLGGSRDILGHLDARGSHRLFGVDISHAVCAGGRSRVPGAHVVQADITALPFRTGSLDAVVDLSTLDHLSGAGVAQAIGEYRRVLRDRGVLLVVFWQRNLMIRLRLLCKRLLGRREKTDQQYFTVGDVCAAFGDGLAVVDEFVVGLLLVPPFALTGALLGRLPTERRGRFLRWLVALEHAPTARPLLRHVAGLYGFSRSGTAPRLGAVRCLRRRTQCPPEHCYAPHRAAASLLTSASVERGRA